RSDLHLGDLVIDVREEVSRLARSIGHQQSPAYYDQTQGGRVYLAPRVAATPPQGSANVAALPPPASAPAQTPQQQPATPRAWLGVRIQQVTDEVAESLNVKPARGALIVSVDEGGPAKPAGMHVGDVIVRYDGKDIKEMRELPTLVAETPVGKTVEIVVVRKGKEETLVARLGQVPQADRKPEPDKKPEPTKKPGAEKDVAALPDLPADSPFKEFFDDFFKRRQETAGDRPVIAAKVLGMDLTTITRALRERLKIKDSVNGVVIAAVEPGSPAADKKLKPGDVIVELAQDAVSDAAAVQTRIDQLRKSGRKTALMLVANPAGDMRFVALPLP
ncbi:MAG: PDZ domain-containing protein, partial [Hyphomonadaceae bacterium]|nr:PDZ domain-containing protein [Hyphomonadaceae bacterium]